MTLHELYCRSYQSLLKIASPIMGWREPELLEGPGSLGRLADRLGQEGVDRLLVVTDKGIVKAGLLKGLLDILGRAGIAVSVYDDTVPNPTLANVEAAFAAYRSEGCRAILALGGGSAMDCAKGVGVRAARPRTPLKRMRGILKVRARLPFLVAVPTTAGTGSEVTIAAVLTDPETHDKFAISDEPLIPRLAVLDPLLTIGLPPSITSTTGMDALTHAVEAFIGRSNTKDTEAAAIEATRIIMADLVTAWKDGSDVARRGRLLRASYLAGKAFTRAYVGYAHAAAHSLGGRYGVAHGLANAVILPRVLEAYGNAAEGRLALLARASGLAGPSTDDADTSRRFIARIREMNAEMGIATTIAGMREADIPDLAARALAEGNPFYPVPRIFGKEEMERLFGVIGGFAGDAASDGAPRRANEREMMKGGTR